MYPPASNPVGLLPRTPATDQSYWYGEVPVLTKTSIAPDWSSKQDKSVVPKLKSTAVSVTIELPLTDPTQVLSKSVTESKL